MPTVDYNVNGNAVVFAGTPPASGDMIQIRELPI